MLYCCVGKIPAKAAPAIATQPALMHRKPGETLMQKLLLPLILPLVPALGVTEPLREMEANAHDEHGHEAERQEESDLDLAHGAEAPQAVITTSTTPHSTQDYPDEAIILSPSGRYRSAPRAC